MTYLPRGCRHRQTDRQTPDYGTIPVDTQTTNRLLTYYTAQIIGHVVK